MSVQPKHEEKDGGPAFPWTWWDADSSGQMQARETCPGMSYRAWAAGRALQGQLTNNITGQHRRPKMAAEEAVAYADALIEALKK